MELSTIVLVWMGIVSIAIVALLVYIASSRRGSNDSLIVQLMDLKRELFELKTNQIEMQTKALHSQQEHLTKLISTVNEILSASQKNINEQLGTTGKLVVDINQKLGILEETTRAMHEVGKDIASLQDILATPKLRGNLGEFLLEELLKQILPSQNYSIQHEFKNGTKVDAAIRLGERIIPVDSKFPLEDFQRILETHTDEAKKKYKRAFIQNVKRKIDDIRSKYIHPDEGTYDFALMYIPAENVFYEVIISNQFGDDSGAANEIFTYALENRVIPVSPNSFYAYLMAIVYGLKGLKIEQQAQEILKGLSTLQELVKRFYDEYSKTGKHLKNALSSYDSSQKQLDRFNDKLSSITGVQVELLDE